MQALRKHGLQGGPDVRGVVDDARKKHKVKPVWLPTVRRTVELEDPRAMLEAGGGRCTRSERSDSS